MWEVTLDDVISNWQDQPKLIARELTDKYGEPTEINANIVVARTLVATSLVWIDNGPWKRTVLKNEEILHNFPRPHRDSLESVIDYRVPPESASDLARFNGSIIIDRTKGEMSARCESESMNILALNLAHDIITGKRSVEEAREEYSKQVMAYTQGQSSPYLEKLQFEVERGRAADPDEPVTRAA